MRIAAATGTSTRTLPDVARDPEPSIRPSSTKSSTGTPTVPKSPSGSRTKILTSSHVSFHSPFIRLLRPAAIGHRPCVLVSHRMSRQLDEHILERRQDRPEVLDADLVLGNRLNHAADEIIALALEHVGRFAPRD